MFCEGLFAISLFRPTDTLRNPGTFYFEAADRDWTTPQNADLWQDESKTLFDPCPIGWRVPPSGENEQSPWQAFSLTNGTWLSPGGLQWGTTIVFISNTRTWYPCTGIRSIAQGDMMITDKEAYYWATTSLPAGSSSHLGFSQTFIDINKRGNRAYALPVRCIRE